MGSKMWADEYPQGAGRGVLRRRRCPRRRRAGMISYIIGSTIGFVGAGIARPFSLRPHFLFSFRKGNGVARQRKRGPRKTGSASRAAIASEEASSIPFPPGRRKLHIRSLLLPSQIVTVSLGHNLAIWNFTTPHAVLMMAGT